VTSDDLFGVLAFGDVARDGEHQPRLVVGMGRPLEPAIGPIGMPVAVLEVEHQVTLLRLLADLGQRPLQVVGVNELDERTSRELVELIAENL